MNPNGPASSRSGRPTLEMVAERAGVSRGTASRVLSGASNVSESAIAAVRAAAAELHYRPNLAARSLVTGRSGLVGLVVNQNTDRLWSDPFHQQIAAGAHRVLTEAGDALVLSITDCSTPREVLLDLVTTRLDALLIVRGPGDAELVRALVDTGVPCALASRPEPDLVDRVCWVTFDNLDGGRAATQHLVDRGRRRIAVVTGPMDNGASHERRDAWRAVLTEAGLPCGDELVVHGDWSIGSAHTAVAGLLARDPGIDAVFAFNDLMGLGALRAVTDTGRAVPDDIAIVGFGDFMAAEVEPPMTSVHVDIQEAGAELARLVLGCQGDGCRGESRLLPTELVVRETS